MKNLIAAILVISLFVSCNKDNSPTQKEYEIEYKIELAPIANTTLSGKVEYISKTSRSADASLSSPGWSVKESNWKLESGDRVGFSTSKITNLGSYKAYLIIDGAVQTFESATSTLPISGKIELYYTIP